MTGGKKLVRRKMYLRFLWATEQNWKCLYCTARLKWGKITLDHPEPISVKYGGAGKHHRAAPRAWPIDGKYIAACALCNNHRGNNDLEYVMLILLGSRPPVGDKSLAVLWQRRQQVQNARKREANRRRDNKSAKGADILQLP